MYAAAVELYITLDVMSILARTVGWPLVIATMTMIAGCSERNPNSVLPVPVLPPGPIEMRVAYVINPRLPRLDSAQLGRLLEATRKTSQEHFGVDLRFVAPVEIPIDSLFQRIPAERRRSVSEFIYDFKTGKGDPILFEKAFVTELKNSGDPVADVLRFATPYLNEPPESSYEALGTALAKIQLNRIEKWKNLKALDGGPVIDSSPYNEYVLWDSLGYAKLPFELLVTNQIIASAEYRGSAAHSAVRGGYTNGITINNAHSRFSTTSIWSTFAFTSADDWVVRVRNGETYQPQEAARLAGILAVHEIGHQLFHFGHPWGRAACVMNPIPMFAYRQTVNNISAKDCPIGSSPAMRPGSAKFSIRQQ